MAAGTDEVEVEVDDQWCFGVLRGWKRDADGGWWAQVAYSAGPGDNRLDSFPAARVRQMVYCPWHQGHHQCLGWDGCTETLAVQ